MTYQFHKKHHTIRMEGYDEALVHMGAELDQAKKESYKYGWLNSLTVMKVQKEDKLLDQHDPDYLDMPESPFKLDASWMPSGVILVNLIRNYLGDYCLSRDEV